MTAAAPEHPAGSFQTPDEFDVAKASHLIEALRQAPQRLSEAVVGLNDEQLNTKYRNWTIRQIVHHVADSHVHSYIRFKWTLTEDQPTIKAYEEADWVQTADSISGCVQPSLALLSGLHDKWMQTIQAMTSEQFQRKFTHPQTGDHISLWFALNYYPWHAKHHTAQILWLRKQHGW